VQGVDPFSSGVLELHVPLFAFPARVERAGSELRDPGAQQRSPIVGHMRKRTSR
jgi:hypothetical protein